MQRFMKICAAVLLLFAGGLQSFGQQKITVTGTVTDATGDAVIGAALQQIWQRR